MSEEKALYIFGRNVNLIPCFRNSFLYGISGGIGCGLLHFLFTSKVSKSTHVSFGSYLGITLSYWFYCRYNYSKREKELEEIKEHLKKKIVLEGTELEKKHINAEAVKVKNEPTKV